MSDQDKDRLDAASRITDPVTFVLVMTHIYEELAAELLGFPGLADRIVKRVRASSMVKGRLVQLAEAIEYSEDCTKCFGEGWVCSARGNDCDADGPCKNAAPCECVSGGGGALALCYSRDWACRRLRSLMSDVSEACHCAQWLRGTEEVLPALLVKAARAESDDAAAEIVGAGWHSFGGWGSVEIAQEAVMLAGVLGHWVNYEGHPYKPKSVE